AAGHVDPQGVSRIVGDETVDQGSVAAVQDLDVAAAALARAGDDVGYAVAVNVARADAHPAGERHVVGEEAEFLSLGQGVEDLHQGPGRRAVVGADDDDAIGHRRQALHRRPAADATHQSRRPGLQTDRV